MKFKCLTLLCVLMVFSQLLPVDGEVQKEKRRERTQNGKGGRSHPRSNKNVGSQIKGKFMTKEKAACTWVVNEKEATTLLVDCKKEEDTFSCAFSGSPFTCPQYAENQKAFWKQIARSLKKQKNLCGDPKSILKSKICKKGPPTAHLRLVAKQEIHVHGNETLLVSELPVAPEKHPEKESRDCVEDIDYVNQEKVAEEYCSEMWLSFCKLFVSMVQDKKC